MVIATVTVITACATRTIRVSHLLLSIGAFVLVIKGVRFIHEFVLLTLPLLRAHPLILTTHLKRPVAKPVYLAGAAILLEPVMHFESLIDCGHYATHNVLSQ
jgi:hypothetical protein